MSIEKEILEFISKGGNELSTREIEAVLTDYNYHSEVEVLDQILEHMVNVGFLTADFDRAEGTMYEITERGIGYMIGRKESVFDDIVQTQSPPTSKANLADGIDDLNPAEIS